MGQAIGDSLPAAIGIALSPLPIVAVVLMLTSGRAGANSLLFIAGWVLGLALVGVIALPLASGAGASKSGGPADWVSWVKLALGLALLAASARQWRQRPLSPGEVERPKWMSRLDTFTPGRAAAVGAALAAVNPKNLLLALAGISAIAETGISTGQQAGAYAVFVAIATVGVAAPVAIYYVRGERSRATLDELREWMEHNNTVVIATLLLVFGWKLIGDAISGLT